MTHLELYKNLIDGIFGSGTATFNPSPNTTNKVIGALASNTDFVDFQCNFAARLKRLQTAYTGHPSLTALIIQVNLVADNKNWQGAVAELAAYDYFISKRDFLSRLPILDVNINPSESLASLFSVQQANVDVYFDTLGVYSDIKVLKDNVSEILDGIYRKIWPNNKPLIRAEFPRDATFELLQNNLDSVFRLLNAAVSGVKKPRLVDASSVVADLFFRLDWTRGMLITSTSYSPYSHAENTCGLPLIHAKKFLTKHPFFLTFVLFPWFNNVVNSFNGLNKIYYRSLSRRVFCQYRNDPSLFSVRSSRFTGVHTIFEVTRNLGAMLFLEDNSILSTSPEKTNVVGHYFENPNAYHPPSCGPMESYLRDLIDGSFDDFTHDNY